MGFAHEPSQAVPKTLTNYLSDNLTSRPQAHANVGQVADSQREYLGAAIGRDGKITFQLEPVDATPDAMTSAWTNVAQTMSKAAYDNAKDRWHLVGEYGTADLAQAGGSAGASMKDVSAFPVESSVGKELDPSLCSFKKPSRLQKQLSTVSKTSERLLVKLLLGSPAQSKKHPV